MNTLIHAWNRAACALLLAALLCGAAQPAAAQSKGQFTILGPAGSSSFGHSVTVLPNGNFVVTDPYYDNGATSNVGAVYLYNGATKALISTMKGSQANDMVGGTRITLLQDGNFLVSSAYWDNGTASNAGAVTWCSKTSGCPANISAANSLVGSSSGDSVGFFYIYFVNSGTYIIPNSLWDNSGISNAGAITFCSTSSPCVGTVSAVNSLVGSSANDHVGSGNLYTLPSGRFVVTVTGWDNGSAVDAGAMRYCSAWDSCQGAISSSNSLVGSTTNDYVGMYIRILTDGNFLVRSPQWDDSIDADVGAVTFCGPSYSCHGTISSSNSLIGEHANDQVGSGSPISLANGRYVVLSPNWDHGSISNAGAATFCGLGGCSGFISASNSLLGASNGDQVGYKGIHLPVNDNYLILSPTWDNGGNADVGAATRCSGFSGCTGEVTTSNSLVGSAPGDGLEMDAVASYDVNNYMLQWPNWDNDGTSNAGAVTWCSQSSGCTGTLDETDCLVGSHANDQVGLFGMELGSGRYAVVSYNWNGSAAGAGAVTFCTSLSGCPGVVSPVNSLVGSSEGDHVGEGSYVWDTNALIFNSPKWRNGPNANAGAVTFCKLDSLSSCSGGYLSADNSLVGTHDNDQVGKNGSFFFLPNGNYVVPSIDWNGVGAVTFCGGTYGCKGAVSTDNSLVGSQNLDSVGIRTLRLANGNYVVSSHYWDNGSVSDAGAVTFCSGTSGCLGTISSLNSLVGTQEGYFLGYDELSELENGDYLVVTSYWPDGAMDGEGNLAWCDGVNGCRGAVEGYPRSVNGKVSEGSPLQGVYDPVNNQVLVGRPLENRVTILDSSLLFQLFLPMIKR